MRVAFISDIHGNAIALDAVLNDINKKAVDRIFVLGDICFKGPEPKRSLDLLRSINAEIIKGNAEEWMVRGIREEEVSPAAFEMMKKERDWGFNQLDEDSIQYLKNLPSELKVQLGNVKIHAFHATPSNLFKMVQPFESDEVLKEKLMINDADIYLYAHIHKPFIRYINGKCFINTGSVGMPFDGMQKASYVLLDIEEDYFHTTLVRVGYDVSKVIKQYEEFDYPNSAQMIQIMTNAGI
jgi:putative phosphoesterase